MRSNRMKRVDDQVRQVIAEALLTRVADPRIGMVSVVAVKVSPEFDTARVWVTVLGDEDERERTLQGLRSAGPFLQSAIGRAMRIRRIPKLRFLYDDSLDRAFRVGEALREARAGAAEPEPEPEPEPGEDP